MLDLPAMGEVQFKDVSKMDAPYFRVSICERSSFSIRKFMDAVISAVPILGLLSIHHIERNILVLLNCLIIYG